jgi:hypothetical protein
MRLLDVPSFGAGEQRHLMDNWMMIIANRYSFTGRAIIRNEQKGWGQIAGYLLRRQDRQ